MERPKVCGQLFCCDDGCGEVDVGFEADISFVISRGDGSEFLDLGEIVFDQVAPSIHHSIEVDLFFTMPARRNDRECTTFIKFCSQPVGIESFISQQRTECHVLDQWLDANHVVALARQKNKPNQVSQGVNHGDDLGGQATFRTADGLSFSPPLAPLAF